METETSTLTREQILEMEAGREMDALAAELLLGYVWVTYTYITSIGDERTVSVLLPEHVANKAYWNQVGMRWGRYGELDYDGVPEFSTDIAEAWRVVEKLQESGFHAHLRTPFDVGHPSYAGFTPQGSTGFNGRPDHEAPGATMPEAICRAALLTTIPA